MTSQSFELAQARVVNDEVVTQLLSQTISD